MDNDEDEADDAEDEEEDPEAVGLEAIVCNRLMYS
jgi:hypothetical protein